MSFPCLQVDDACLALSDGARDHAVLLQSATTSVERHDEGHQSPVLHLVSDRQKHQRTLYASLLESAARRVKEVDTEVWVGFLFVVLLFCTFAVVWWCMRRRPRQRPSEALAQADSSMIFQAAEGRSTMSSLERAEERSNLSWPASTSKLPEQGSTREETASPMPSAVTVDRQTSRKLYVSALTCDDEPTTHGLLQYQYDRESECTGYEYKRHPSCKRPHCSFKTCPKCFWPSCSFKTCANFTEHVHAPDSAGQCHSTGSVEVNVLGHLFTYSRDSFWNLVQNIEPELHGQLYAFGRNHPQCPSTNQYTPSELEAMNFAHDERAFAWQQEYEDDDDERTSHLLALLRMLWQVVCPHPMTRPNMSSQASDSQEPLISKFVFGNGLLVKQRRKRGTSRRTRTTSGRLPTPAAETQFV